MRKENNQNNAIQNDELKDRNTTKKLFILFNLKQYMEVIEDKDHKKNTIKIFLLGYNINNIIKLIIKIFH